MIKHRLDTVEIRENGLIKLDLKNLPIPETFTYQYVISIPAGVIGGNHKHRHQEIFFSTDEHLEVHWINAKGEKEHSKFKEGNALYLFHIPAGTPHAVINTSKDNPAVLIEFADQKSIGVERFVIL